MGAASARAELGGEAAVSDKLIIGFFVAVIVSAWVCLWIVLQEGQP
jgi:hypothetical protein